jgi:hypothetical protein
MKLLKAGQLVNLETQKVQNILEFERGFIVELSDQEYEKVIRHLQTNKTTNQKESFYVEVDEEGVKAL